MTHPVATGCACHRCNGAHHEWDEFGSTRRCDHCDDCLLGQLVASYVYPVSDGMGRTDYYARRDMDPTYKNYAKLHDSWNCIHTKNRCYCCNSILPGYEGYGRVTRYGESPNRDPPMMYEQMMRGTNELARLSHDWREEWVLQKKCTCCQCLYCRSIKHCPHTERRQDNQVQNDRVMEALKAEQERARRAELEATKRANESNAQLKALEQKHAKAMKNLGTTVDTLAIRRQSHWFQQMPRMSIVNSNEEDIAEEDEEEEDEDENSEQQ